MHVIGIIIWSWLWRAAGDWAGLLLPRAQRWKDIQSSWGESRGATLTVFLWIVGALLVGLTVFTVLYQKKENAKRRERERVYFRNKAAEKELDQKHIKMLSEAIQAAGLSQPFRILDSYDIFQNLLERYEKKAQFLEQEHQYFHQMVDEIKEKLGFNKIEDAVELKSTKDIHPGQEVKVSFKKPDRKYDYDALVKENTDNMIALDTSGMDLKTVNLQLDDTIEVNFYRGADAGYKFVTTLRGYPDEKKHLLPLKHPSRLERTQARNFSRMDVHFPFSYHYITERKFNNVEIDRNLEKCEALPAFVAESADISGGGLALNTRKKVSKGDYIYLNFQMISDYYSEPVLSEVVWAGKDKTRGDNLVRIKFYHITDRMRDELMKFIYQMQRKSARRLKFAPKK